MLTAYAIEDGRMTVVDPEGVVPDAARPVWIDLLNPTPQEEGRVQSALAIEIPTREEMQEIEVSSRLYREGDALYLTAPFLYGVDTGEVASTAITFVLSADTLVTVRYATPKAFGVFAARAARSAAQSATADGVALGLIEQVVDRLADILERVGADMDRTSQAAFKAAKSTQRASAKDAVLKDALIALGQVGEVTARASETLVGLARIMSFVAAEGSTVIRKENRGRVKTIARDLRSLSEHGTFLNDKATFLLDAVLGIINIEQTAIIKTFSVVSVALMPPTLIASVYGMNFKLMPELDWSFGYPLAIGVMVVSAVLPLLYFRRKGWL
jgi:magnesium transporter